MGNGWDGSFTLNMQSNVRYSIEEFEELSAFMATDAYRKAPGLVHCAILAAWHREKESLALYRGCIADFCAPWFEDSVFENAEPQVPGSATAGGTPMTSSPAVAARLELDNATVGGGTDG